MSTNIPTKPFREKIADAVAADGGILNPGDSLQTVSDRMVALDTNVLPVSEGGRLVGLAEDSNPGLNASEHGHDPKTMRIAETMNRNLVFCLEGDDCAGAVSKMKERNLSHLPVVDSEMRMVAFVAREDLIVRIERADADHVEAGTVGTFIGFATSAENTFNWTGGAKGFVVPFFFGRFASGSSSGGALTGELGTYYRAKNGLGYDGLGSMPDQPEDPQALIARSQWLTAEVKRMQGASQAAADANEAAAEIVRRVTGETVEDIAESISDPEARRLYLEAKEKLKAERATRDAAKSK